MARAVVDGACDCESDELMLIREDPDVADLSLTVPSAFGSVATTAPELPQCSDGPRTDVARVAGCRASRDVARCRRCVRLSFVVVRNLPEDDDNVAKFDGRSVVDRLFSAAGVGRCLDQSRLSPVSCSFIVRRSDHFAAHSACGRL